MKKHIVASACVLVPGVSGAMAQTQPTQPAPGASSESNVSSWHVHQAHASHEACEEGHDDDRANHGHGTLERHEHESAARWAVLSFCTVGALESEEAAN
jgi:hypothetical protein